MNGLKYLADTNAFIYLLNRHPALQTLLDSEWQYSFITEIELLGKPNITKAEAQNIRNLLAVCTKVLHHEAINQTTILLKQQYHIKLPDALIAATALEQNLPLITFDKGFTRIKTLDLILLDV